MKHKLVLLGALVAIIGVFAARVPAEAATEPFSATYAITFTACTSGGTCNGNGTIDAGEPVGTSVHTSLDSAGGAFYDAVESVQSGVIPQTGVPAGDTVGTGSFLIHVTAGARCNPAGGFINPSYTIYATNDLNNTGTYPSLGYAKGLTGTETWSTFSAAGWIQDFDDDNNNNIPDSVEGGSGASTLPMTVRQTISAGKPDGAFKEPLYLPLLDQIVGATHTTRAFGDAVVAAGVSEVPVDFVNYVGIPSAGQTTQFAVINEGGGLGLLPASPGGASIQTCPPFTSDISVNALSSSGAIVQKADVGGSYQYQIQISTAPDFDGDGIPNGLDNCPQVANAAQTDTDGDGIGDACDPAPTTPAAADADGDGFPNYADSCPFVKSIVDSDSDGISNECDPAPSVAGDGHGYADGFNDNDATQTATYSIPLAAGVVNGGAPVTFVDSNDNHIADSLETTIGCSDPKGSGLKACDSDGDGAPDASDADPLNPNDQGGNRLTKCAGDCEFDPNFPNFVGDGCKDTDPNEPHSSSTDPWKYYDVPAPALFAAPSPTTDFRLSGSLGAAMGQAVFGYFKKAAKLGTQLYDQDLNQNNVMDGVEYDRSLPGGILSGPDGVISSADAQKAFSQFKANIKCASGPAYRLNDSTTSN